MIKALKPNSAELPERRQADRFEAFAWIGLWIGFGSLFSTE
jgi:hypothetical protein